jgi:predicted alpha/beta-fold hydrolase
MSVLSRIAARTTFTVLHVVYHIVVYLLFERFLIATLLRPALRFLGLWPQNDALEARCHHADAVAVIVKAGGTAQRLFDIASGVVPDPATPSGGMQNAAGRAGSPNADEVAAEAARAKLQRYTYTAPLYGPHFSTIFSVVARGPLVVPNPVYKRELVETVPGVRVALDWCCSKARGGRPPTAVLFICPGLNSTSDNGYIRSFVNSCTNSDAVDVDVVVVSSRGYTSGGTDGPLLEVPQPFHAGLTTDLRAVVYSVLTPGALRRRYGLKKDAPAPPLFGVGFSMGGNVLAKFLEEEGSNVLATALPSLLARRSEDADAAAPTPVTFFPAKEVVSERVASPRRTFTHEATQLQEEEDRLRQQAFRPQILCAFAIGAPWSLITAIHNLARGANHMIYESAFLEGLQQMCGRHFDRGAGAINLDGVRNEVVVIDYDEHHVSRLQGFTSAAHYYSSTQAFDRLAKVRVPLFCVVSAHDSICGLAKPDQLWAEVCGQNERIAYMRLPSGGHLGNLGDPWDEFQGKATPLERLVIDETLLPILHQLRR